MVEVRTMYTSAEFIYSNLVKPCLHELRFVFGLGFIVPVILQYTVLNPCNFVLLTLQHQFRPGQYLAVMVRCPPTFGYAV